MSDEQESSCSKCEGSGVIDAGVDCSPSEAMWFSDGEPQCLGSEKCPNCKGTGKIRKKKRKSKAEGSKQK